MASFQAKAATRPREVVIRVTVWAATFWWIGFFVGLAFMFILYWIPGQARNDGLVWIATARIRDSQ